MRLIQCLRGPTSPSGMVFERGAERPAELAEHLFRGVEGNAADQKDVLLHAGAPDARRDRSREFSGCARAAMHLRVAELLTDCPNLTLRFCFAQSKIRGVIGCSLAGPRWPSKMYELATVTVD